MVRQLVLTYIYYLFLGCFGVVDAVPTPYSGTVKYSSVDFTVLIVTTPYSGTVQLSTNCSLPLLRELRYITVQSIVK